VVTATRRLTADRGRCLGSGQCVLIAPDTFAQRPSDGTVIVLAPQPTPDQLADVAEAVEQCPVHALTLDDGSRNDTTRH
jgi:ferredoxin